MIDNNFIKTIFTRCEEDIKSFERLYHDMYAVSKVFDSDLDLTEMILCHTRIAKTYISLLEEIGDDKYKKDNNDYIFEIKSLEARYEFWRYEMLKLWSGLNKEALTLFEIKEKGNGRADVIRKETNKPKLWDYAKESIEIHPFLSNLKTEDDPEEVEEILSTFDKSDVKQYD
jgi:hypothetical protein